MNDWHEEGLRLNISVVPAQSAIGVYVVDAVNGGSSRSLEVHRNCTNTTTAARNRDRLESCSFANRVAGGSEVQMSSRQIAINDSHRGIRREHARIHDAVIT